ncbi:hypothetical protein PLEOSDRAFT_158498 [Pleurotus ostreatus PC15]|uniref:Uncharacterized protein n=1 Tax=Pleurotus ostreatus (strain PC15) TaxID=1137138 RepID=A0A067NID2_PLEO1|nr:hypothetical protein PLEOSDRAFT_158498 [Pleurotus ostreatus PC15]
MATYRTSSTVPADIITYRKDDKLVFVQPASSYVGAIEEARKVFPELVAIPDDRIGFYITATLGHSKAQVRVSESAWCAAIARLLRGEVVDVRVVEADVSISIDPPRYLEVPDTKETSSDFYNANNDIRESRSAPSSRSPSRQASPSGRIRSHRSWWQLPS